MGTTSKALSLLDYFTFRRPLIGLSDLGRLSGHNKATCFRLMAELCDHGLAEQVGPGREYRIGPAVLRLSALREASVPTREAALPVLQTLARRTNETAHLSHLVAGRLTTLAFAYGPGAGMKVMMEDADILPFHATSSGFATLAFLPQAVADAVLSGPMPALTRATPVSADLVRAEMAVVRQRGWAQTAHTYEADVSSVAVPLFDAQGACQGALAVAAPAMRMTDRRRAGIARDVIAAARAVMDLWGGMIPADLAGLWADIEQPELKGVAR